MQLPPVLHHKRSGCRKTARQNVRFDPWLIIRSNAAAVRLYCVELQSPSKTKSWRSGNDTTVKSAILSSIFDGSQESKGISVIFRDAVEISGVIHIV
jgi:hypothetical protein